jgi:hypothetical protein
VRVDYPEFERLNEKAGREQALAVYELLIAPLARLLGIVKGQS